MAKKKSSYTVSWTMPDGKRRYYRGATKKEAQQKKEADRKKIEEGYGYDLANSMSFR